MEIKQQENDDDSYGEVSAGGSKKESSFSSVCQKLFFTAVEFIPDLLEMCHVM